MDKQFVHPCIYSPILLSVYLYFIKVTTTIKQGWEIHNIFLLQLECFINPDKLF